MSWLMICCLVWIPWSWWPSREDGMSWQASNSSGTSIKSVSDIHKLCKTQAAKIDSTRIFILENSNRKNLLNRHFNKPNDPSMTCLLRLCSLLNFRCCLVRLPQSRKGVISHYNKRKTESPNMTKPTGIFPSLFWNRSDIRRTVASCVLPGFPAQT